MATIPAKFEKKAKTKNWVRLRHHSAQQRKRPRRLQWYLHKILENLICIIYSHWFFITVFLNLTGSSIRKNELLLSSSNVIKNDTQSELPNNRTRGQLPAPRVLPQTTRRVSAHNAPLLPDVSKKN